MPVLTKHRSFEKPDWESFYQKGEGLEAVITHSTSNNPCFECMATELTQKVGGIDLMILYAVFSPYTACWAA